MPDHEVVFAPFRLDLLNEQLWQGEALVPLRPKLFAVLRHLVEHAGRVVTREELRKAVWPTTEISESVLRGVIRELRDTLGDEATAAQFVETVPYRGYRFVAPVTAASVPSAEFRVPSSPSPTISDIDVGKTFSFQLGTWNLKPETCVVGRDRELHQLHIWLNKALKGERQVVFVLGEPGIGKTTLVDAFLQSLASRVQSLESEDQKQPEVRTLDPRRQTLDARPWIARGQCIEHYGAGEAYLPVLEALGQLCRQSGGEQVRALLSRYAPTWLVQMPALVGDTEFEALQRKVQGATRERMLREMAEALEALTAVQPLVLVIEDVHWSDASTLDLLSLLAQRRGPARLLLLVTYRPAEVITSGHPLKALKQELQVHGQCEELPLGFLTVAEVVQYLAARFLQQRFPAELGRIIHQSTEGNPLFMVNVVDEWVRQRVLIETDGQWQVRAKMEDLAAGVPESLRLMIERQLGRLTPEERRMVETASVVGGEFLTAAVAAGLEEKGERVEKWCEGLAKREQFVQARGTETLADGTITGRYGFLHALYQQVLYELLTPLRRVQLHRRIGEWEEGTYGQRVSQVAAELAVHFERGQDPRRAVRYLIRAGENALRHSAHPEAISLLTKGLALLTLLPETPKRIQYELVLQGTLGATLAVTKGYAAPEVQHAHERALLLCKQMGDAPQLFPVLAGLWGFHFLRAELHTAKELAAQLFRLVQATPDPALLLWAHTLQGLALYTLGELPVALKHLEEGIVSYDPQLHRPDHTRVGAQDPKVICLSYAAHTLWCLGHTDQARRKMAEAITLARELSHPFSLAFALDFAGAGVNMFLRDVPAVQTHAEMLRQLCHEQGFPYWLGWGTVRQGWVLVAQGQVEAGITKMRQGMEAVQITGAELSMSYILVHLAEAYGKLGQEEKGLPLLTEALTRVERTGERWYEAELYRLRGELTLTQSSVQSLESRVQKNQKAKIKRQKQEEARDWRLETGPSSSQAPSLKPLVPEEALREAEEYFLKAIEIARKQAAKSLELRAVMSLVRLRRQQTTQRRSRTRLEEAHNMLSEVYTWFTEGFDTPDLKEAEALLEELSG